MGRTQPPDAGSQCLLGGSAGGWESRRLARQGCSGTGTDPIIRSRNRSPRRKARGALSWLGRPGGRHSVQTADAWQPGATRTLLRPASCDSGTRARAGCCCRRFRTPTMFQRIAFHPDGKLLAAGDYNGLVRFWDTSTGREIGRPLPQGEIVHESGLQPGRHDARGGSRHGSCPQARHATLGYHDTPSPSVNYCQARTGSPGSSSGRMVKPCSRRPTGQARGSGMSLEEGAQ